MVSRIWANFRRENSATGGRIMASTRRLTTILAADVAGYSRLMGADEEGTHERLKAHLAELVEPKIAEHRGRIVKNTGDGLLAEFPSVLELETAEIGPAQPVGLLEYGIEHRGEIAGRGVDDL